MQRKRQAHGKVTRSRMDHVESPSVCGVNHVTHPWGGVELEQTQSIRVNAKRPRCLTPPGSVGHLERQDLGDDGGDVRLVQGAGHADQIAQMRCDALAVASKPLGRSIVHPAALTDHPARRGEVMVRHHGRQAVFAAGDQHAAIVLEGSEGELAFLRFDAGPLEREAVGVEAQLRQQRDVAGIAMVVVAGIARWLCIDGVGQMLEHPALTVGVVAFHLVTGRGRPPEKAFRKIDRCHVIP